MRPTTQTPNPKQVATLQGLGVRVVGCEGEADAAVVTHTLNPEPSTLNPQPSTLHPEP